MQETLSRLRASLAALETPEAPPEGRFGLGVGEVDAALGGGLARGRVHEVFAGVTADAAAAAGFAAALALRGAGGRPVMWVRQAFCEIEAGRLHARGLAGLGLDPDALLMVRVPDVLGVLRAGGEALGCRALGAVVIEPWGAPPEIDFTVSRRLSLAAAGSGVACLFLRLAATPHASAAATRWKVAAAPSRPFPANAPGRPAFDIALLRQRGGTAGRNWRLEWDHELRVFNAVPALSGGAAAVPAGRPAAALERLARAG